MVNVILQSFMLSPSEPAGATPAMRQYFDAKRQCRDCQRRSGTGHGSWLTFPARAEMSISGEATCWEVAADSGNVKRHAFCPVCGAPVFLRFAAAPDFIAVPAGSLDDPERFAPQALTYAARALAWDAIDPALPAFERMPPS